MLALARNPQPMVAFLIGGPGSGRATQAQKVVAEFGLTHLDVGAILRQERDAASSNSDLVAAMVRNHDLVGQELVVELLQRAILSQPNKRGFVVSGFPRSIGQATHFEEVIGPCRFIISLDVSDDVLEKRLLANGESDLSAVRRRIAMHKERSAPVLQYYDKLGKLKRVGGGSEASMVYQQLRQYFITVPDGAIDLTKPQSILDVEPIYCAEQIRIPPDVPDILREFAKEVIRHQPDDILVFAAEYFAEKAASAPLVVTVDQLYRMQQSMATGEDLVTKADIVRAARHAEIESSVIDHVFRFKGFGSKDIAWPAFIVFACSMIAESRSSTVDIIFKVFAKDNGFKLKVEIFWHLFGFLAEADGVDSATLATMEGRLKKAAAAHDGFVTFLDYQESIVGLDA